MADTLKPSNTPDPKSDDKFKVKGGVVNRTFGEGEAESKSTPEKADPSSRGVGKETGG